MQRLNFTLDGATIDLLESLASRFHDGNKSQTVRAALEFLAENAGASGWIIKGYSPTEVEDRVECHSCGEPHGVGEILYRPVFERGVTTHGLAHIPSEAWLECPDCVDRRPTS